MIVTVIAATTKDGFIAHPDKTTISVSAEDSAFLSEQLAAHDTHIMGATTFRAMLAHLTQKYAHKRYVLTKHPEDYAKHAHLATFVSQSLRQCLQHADTEQRKSVLVLGGGHLYDESVTYPLADRIYVTLEPYLLHNGIPFLTDTTMLEKHYVLTSTVPLGIHGTMLLTYTKK